jgi:heat shock protein HtpX
MTEVWLLATVRKCACEAGIGMPEVSLYEVPDANAFATGMGRNKALIVVSTGLLQRMCARRRGAALGHEGAHAANGDMVTLALIQGVVNTFVLLLPRVIGHTVNRVIFRTENGHSPAFWVTVIVMWFSRQREFRADRGGASLAGRNSMIAAPERLRGLHPLPLPDKMAGFGIAGGGLKRLFMTHPPLAERIAALQATGPTPVFCRENKK